VAKEFSPSRRSLLKQSALGIAVVAGAGFIPLARLRAADLPLVSEDDPTAKALQYKHDAAESARKDESQLCNNCRYYLGEEGDESAGCQLFPGKAVKGQGWCKSWALKG